MVIKRHLRYRSCSQLPNAYFPSNLSPVHTSQFPCLTELLSGRVQPVEVAYQRGLQHTLSDDTSSNGTIDTPPRYAFTADARAGEWPNGCVEALRALALKCTTEHGERLASMEMVLREIKTIAKTFC